MDTSNIFDLDVFIYHIIKFDWFNLIYLNRTSAITKFLRTKRELTNEHSA